MIYCENEQLSVFCNSSQNTSSRLKQAQITTISAALPRFLFLEPWLI